jgi:hypothetical protein
MNSKRVAAASLAVVVLAVAAVAQTPDNPKAQLNGGLEAEITSTGMNTRSPNYPQVTMSMKIANTGKATAFLLLYGEPSLIDDAGTQYGFKRLGGVAYCQGPLTNPPNKLCVGIPHVDQNFFSPRGYTEIDPGRAITVTFQFQGTGKSGTIVTFSAEMAYRLVTDLDKDNESSDTDKMKQTRFGTLSFEPMTIKEK